MRRWLSISDARCNGRIARAEYASAKKCRAEEMNGIYVSRGWMATAVPGSANRSAAGSDASEQTARDNVPVSRSRRGRVEFEKSEALDGTTETLRDRHVQL